MSEILRDEFEALSSRVDSLEAEIKSLRAQLTGDMAPVISRADSQISGVDGATAANFMEAHMLLRDSYNISINGSAQKILGYDANRVSHKHIKATYFINGRRYVSYSVEDMEDGIWNAFVAAKDVVINTDSANPEYASFDFGDIRIDMVGHVDDGAKWKKQFDNVKQLYYFEKLSVSGNESGKAGAYGKLTSLVGKTGVNLGGDSDNRASVAGSTSETGVSAAGNKQSLEKIIGTKWMGIFASILIFVAFIMFGASIYSMLTNLHKAVILLVISAVFTVVGLVKMRSKTGNVLWHIVSGCGLGGFYITFLLMNMAFYLINEMVLLVLLLIWTAAMIVVAKKFSPVFSYVCYAGVLISTVLCNIKWTDSVIGLVFYVIAVSALIVSNYRREYKHNYFWSVQFPVMFLYFAYEYDKLFTNYVLWALIIGVNLIQNYVFEIDEDSDADLVLFNVSNVFTFISFMALGFNLRYSLEVSEVIVSVLYLISILAMNLNNYFKFRDNTKLYIAIYYVSCIVIPFLNLGSVYTEYIGIAVFFVPMMMAGFALDKRNLFYPSLVYLPLYLFFDPSETMLAVRVVVSLGCLAFLAYTIFVRYSMLLKFYLVGFLSVLIMWATYKHNLFDAGIMYCLLSVVALCMLTKRFENEAFDGVASKVVAFIYNGICMLFGLELLWGYKEPFTIMRETIYETEGIHIALIGLFVLALYVINLQFSRFKRLGISEFASGWFIGIGYSALLLSVLNRLDAVNYVVSLCLIITAIIFIALGFKLDVKSIRLYGLAVSIISVIKLVFVDIDYESSAWYPVGLFVCGGLCLLICWIYNRMEKAINGRDVPPPLSEE